MKPSDIVNHILNNNAPLPQKQKGHGAAPANIALVKYWGKRDSTLNLPMTSSFSLSLSQGAETKVTASETDQDSFILNGKETSHNIFAERLAAFLDLFRPHPQFYFHVSTHSSVPISAGLASSAAGFAALVLALDDFFGWQLDKRSLSVLARLGSGSACRSLWPGFVEWQAGSDLNGMDSHGIPLDVNWPALRVTPLIVSRAPKPIDSRTAMIQTQASSPLYASWPDKVASDLTLMKQAIGQQDFTRLGEIAESNALAMHACMMSAWPPICYHQPATLEAMHRVWALRKAGNPIYFTQDAGPNIKLLYLAPQQAHVDRLINEQAEVAV